MRLINRHPDRAGRLLLVLLPFALLLFAYFTGSASRLAENPNDKLLPSATQMVEAVQRLAFTEDKRSGDYLFWQDSTSSLKRLATGLAIAALLGLCLGIAAGTLPLFGAPLSPLLTVLSMVPPLAILPILFIVFGLGELSKVMLIVIGIAPASPATWSSVPGKSPRAADQGADPGRQHLDPDPAGGAAAAAAAPAHLPAPGAGLGLAVPHRRRAIASTDGLGYRIFLVRRYLAMDVILPYVVWITLLAWLMDLGLRQFTRLAFPGTKEPRHERLHRSEEPVAAYGDQVVLENLNLKVNEGEFCTLVGASGCGKSTFLRMLLGQETPAGANCCWTASPWWPSPTPAAAWYSSATRCSPPDGAGQRRTRPGAARSPLLGRLFGSARREAREQAAAMLAKVGLGHALGKYPRSSPAACSSAWPSPRPW